MFDPKLKEALGRVQKPGRYTGGEPGSVDRKSTRLNSSHREKSRMPSSA